MTSNIPSNAQILSETHVLAEFDRSGNLTKYYTWGPTGLLAITTYQIGTRNPSGKYYVVKNAHRDIIALQDQNGNNVATYSYDTWGNVLISTDTNNINPYRYAGYRYDSVTGLYYLIARYYDPVVGRFLSTDPVIITPDYTYGSDNPISYVDPSGKTIEWVMSIAAGVGEGVAAVVFSEVLVPLAVAGAIVGVGYLIYDAITSDDGSDSVSIPSTSNPSTSATPNPPSPGNNKGSGNKGNKNNQKEGKRGHLKPDPAAKGDHTVLKRNPTTGEITKYETFRPNTNPRFPHPWETVKRFDRYGKSHRNKQLEKYIDTPHVHEPSFPGEVRPPFPFEIP